MQGCCFTILSLSKAHAQSQSQAIHLTSVVTHIPTAVTHGICIVHFESVHTTFTYFTFCKTCQSILFVPSFSPCAFSSNIALHLLKRSVLVYLLSENKPWITWRQSGTFSPIYHYFNGICKSDTLRHLISLFSSTCSPRTQWDRCA